MPKNIFVTHEKYFLDIKKMFVTTTIYKNMNQYQLSNSFNYLNRKIHEYFHKLFMFN